MAADADEARGGAETSAAGLGRPLLLLKDSVQMAEGDTKAKRLRAMRRQRKAAVTTVIDDALKHLQTIGEARSLAREAIYTLDKSE
jgi:hypothetical protein